MAVPVSITLTGGTYGTNPSTPSSPFASAFQFTNNSGTDVTLYFQMAGQAAINFPVSANIAAGGQYTTPALNSGSANFAIVAQGSANPYSHIIHIGAGVP